MGLVQPGRYFVMGRTILIEMTGYSAKTIERQMTQWRGIAAGNRYTFCDSNRLKAAMTRFQGAQP